MTIRSWVTNKVVFCLRQIRGTDAFDRLDMADPIGPDWNHADFLLPIEMTADEIPASMAIADFITLATSKIEVQRTEMIAFAAAEMAKLTGRTTDQFTAKTSIRATYIHDLAGAMVVRFRRPAELMPGITINTLVNRMLGIK